MNVIISIALSNKLDFVMKYELDKADKTIMDFKININQKKDCNFRLSNKFYLTTESYYENLDNIAVDVFINY